MARRKRNKPVETVKVEEVGSWPAEERNAKTEAEIKAESDKRRRARKQQHIRIHGDRIENLDETAERIKKEGEEAKATGYTSSVRVCYRASRLNWLRRIVNSMTSWAYAHGRCCCPMKYYNRMEFGRNFVKTKVVTRCVTMFLGKNKGKKTGFILQPVPLEYLNRMGVEHIEQKRFSWLHRYPYYADLNTYSSVQVMRETGVNPLANKSVRYRLTELRGKELTGELAYYYRMQPVGNYVPMEIKD